MIRRVLCLLLAVQLLLVQGLLSRACFGQCGQAAHATRPHVHPRQLRPTSDQEERPRCLCCQRRLEQSRQTARVVPSVQNAPTSTDGTDDAVYLPGQFLSVETGQKQKWANEVTEGVAVLPAFAPVSFCQDGPQSSLLADPESARLPCLPADPPSPRLSGVLPTSSQASRPV
jgi:hypothetical protein